MGEFRFKRFTVINERSAMKVNTDGVILGASMTISPSHRKLLDIGTGTGTIALMAAQRISEMHGSDFNIIAIDVDEPSASEAASNFEISPWPERLSSRNISLANFASGADKDISGGGKFDLIFSNPPYFETSLKNPDGRRRTARHAEGLSYREILDFASEHLSTEGSLSMILPAETEKDVARHAAASGLYPFRVIRVCTVPDKKPRRIVVELSRTRRETVTERLVIQEKGTYTDEYKSLMSHFLTIF